MSEAQSNNRGTDADGRYLMGALAIHTNAVVYDAVELVPRAPTEFSDVCGGRS